MAINIKDPETDRLARELAAQRGQPITDVVRDALRALEAVEAKKTKDDNEEKLAKLKAIVNEMDALPVLDHRHWKELLDEAWGEDLK